MISLAAWLAWAPFHWRSGAANYQLEPNLDPETLSHLGLLVPLAVVFTASGGGARFRRALRAGVAVAAIASILEAGQWLLELRSVSPYDLAAGWIGGFTAIALTFRALRAGASARAIVWGLTLVIFATLALAVNLNGRWQNQGLRIADWNPRFRVVEGDEWGGRRRYAGDVSDGRICAGEGDDRFCVMPGASLEDRRKLVAIAERTQVLTLAAWVRSDSGRQTGPARIITFSAGPYGRNATLAQSETSLVFRLRSPRAGPNGTWHQFSLRGVVPTGRFVHVLGSFRHGRVRLECIDSSVIHEASFDAPFHGTLHVNGKTRLRTPFVFQGRALLVATLVFFGGAGMLLGLAWGARAGVLVPAAIIIGIALLWTMTLVVWNGSYPGPREHLVIATVVAVGVLAGMWDRVRLCGPESVDPS